MYQLITKEIPLGDGRTITIESGKLAKQADGSVVVRLGKTMLLATVVYAKEAKEDVDFMPLSVEYKEKFAAMGRFPGGFMRREARPSDYEILIARLVDRALRPLFPDDFHAETFVTIQLISAEKEVLPDQLAGLAASAALAVSDIPFHGPISEVRVCRIDGNFVINPPTSEIERADLDMIVGATMNDIMMVEGEMDEVPEEVMLEAISVAHEAIKIQCQAQLELMEMAGKTEKRAYCHEVNDPALKQLVHDRTYSLAYAAAMKQNPNKHERSEAFSQIVKDFIEAYKAEQPEGAEINEKLIKRYYHDVEKEAVRNMVLDEGVRLDGRKTDEIRPIWCEVDYLPAAHGSAVFTRGETQSLTTVTLGTKLDEKIIDEVMNQGTDRFLLHYNFPPFSTGEAKPARGTSRREVGHGNLAHRALKKMIPSDPAVNPYAIRIVSDILESNGSSSMATVCAGTLALLDTGIKMIRPVSGIAMGLISRKDGKFAVLSDILGDEDHLGDMDFKVTGTEKGVTATQMDIKLDGLSYEILSKALNQAKKGREHILKVMTDTMPEARADYKDFVPRIHRIVIPKELIGAVIGPGGKIIQEIQAQSGSIITIEEVNDTGVVEIAASSPDSIKAALRRINAIVAVPEVDKVYNGIVKSIVAFGAFVEIMPGKEGLLHISEISWNRLKTVDEELKEGQEIEVKLIEIDKKTNKFKLSRKVLLERPKRDKDPKAGE